MSLSCSSLWTSRPSMSHFLRCCSCLYLCPKRAGLRSLHSLSRLLLVAWVGASVSTKRRLFGTVSITWRKSSALLNVVMPDRLIKPSISTTASASACPPVKQWIRIGNAPSCQCSRRIEIVSWSASRVWMISGRARCRAARICASNEVRCFAMETNLLQMPYDIAHAGEIAA